MLKELPRVNRYTEDEARQIAEALQQFDKITASLNEKWQELDGLAKLIEDSGTADHPIRRALELIQQQAMFVRRRRYALRSQTHVEEARAAEWRYLHGFNCTDCVYGEDELFTHSEV